MTALDELRNAVSAVEAENTWLRKRLIDGEAIAQEAVDASVALTNQNAALRAEVARLTTEGGAT